MVVGHEAVGEDQLRIRRAALVRLLPAAVGLQLVAEIADIASLERHRHVDVVDELDRLHAPIEAVEDAFLERLDAGLRRHFDNARSDVVADQFGVRPLVVAHEGVAALLPGVRAGVEPVGVLRIAVEGLEADIRRQVGLELLEHRLEAVRFDLRRGSGHLESPLGLSERQILLRQRQEVLDDLFAMLRGDRFGMELDAPERKLLVVDAHDEAVVGHAIDFEAVGKVVYDQGVIACRAEGRGNALEDLLSVVADLADPAVHRRRSVLHGSPGEVSDPLVTEADPEDRLVKLPQDRLAEPEIPLPFRAARSGGEDDRIKIELAKFALGQCVVVNYDRIYSGGRGNKLHEVVRKTIVIVDYKRLLQQ